MSEQRFALDRWTSAGLWCAVAGAAAQGGTQDRSCASGNNGESGPLHVNPYPNTASPGQKHECAAGNEPYTGGYLIGNPPGNLGTHTEKTTRPKG